jgi:hypothetical protein
VEKFGEGKKKMKKSSKLGILLSALLMMSLFAGAYFVSGTSASSIVADKRRSSSPLANEQVTSQEIPKGMVNGGPPTQMAMNDDVSPQGASTSGWKPDIIVAGATDRDEVNPSIASYINSATGAVTMYTAMQKWDPVGNRWYLNIQRSDNRGSSWYYWFSGFWTSPANRSMILPSIAVSPYNGTVFVAVQSSAYNVAPWSLSNDVQVWRINPNYPSDWQFFNVDADVDEDRAPQLVTEYGFGSGNWLYMVYENYTTTDDRDLKVGRSTDWGMTWYTQTLRGAGTDSTTYTEPTIAYAQGNVYISYRHSSTYFANGHIDISYSTDYGGSYTHITDISNVPSDASWPSIDGSHIGNWHYPATVMVAYEYNTSLTNHDILFAWSTDYGGNWSGGTGAFNQIATSSESEFMPRLAVDGMGTENGNIGGNFHLVYRIGDRLYYTQMQYWDIPVMLGPTPWAVYLGWSTPHGNITDTNAYCSYSYPTPAITTYTKTVGGIIIWEPGITWTDLRNPSYDVYYTTPGTDFSITVAPSSQTVVAGTSTYYSFTVNLLSGPTAPAYLSGTHWPWIILGTNFALAEYTASPINPTSTCTLAVTTSNLMPAGNYYFNATATIGGYRRIVAVPFTVIMPPTTVVRGNDNQIYYQTCDTDAQIWTLYPGFGTTCDSPAAAILGNELHIVIRSMDGNSLYHGYVNLINHVFSGWTLLSGSTPSAPTLTANGTHLCLVVRGNDNRIYYSTYSLNPRSWGSWNALTGTTCDSPAAAMLGNNLHIVVRSSTGTSLYHIIVKPNVGVVRNWILLSGSTPSKPVLTADQAASKLYLTVRGGDNKIYWRSYGPSDSWAGWNTVPTGTTGDAPAATVVANKLQIVVRSMTGSTLYHGNINLATSAFSGWTLLSGSTPSPPTLTS